MGDGGWGWLDGWVGVLWASNADSQHVLRRKTVHTNARSACEQTTTPHLHAPDPIQRMRMPPPPRTANTAVRTPMFACMLTNKAPHLPAYLPSHSSL